MQSKKHQEMKVKEVEADMKAQRKKSLEKPESSSKTVIEIKDTTKKEKSTENEDNMEVDSGMNSAEL